MNRGWMVRAVALTVCAAAVLGSEAGQGGEMARGAVVVSGKPAAPTEEETKQKEKWRAALNEAMRDLRASNDQETAGFVKGLLAVMEKPEGTPAGWLATVGEQVKERVHQLVKRGALESASSLNFAMWEALHPAGKGMKGPEKPNQRSGGSAGPGGLVLYFSFDKPDENGVVKDESGAGNDGKVTGAKWVSEGKFGGAYKFNIENLTDRIVVENSDTLNVETVTLAAWIKTGEKDGFWNRIIDKDFRNAYCLDLGGDYKGKGARSRPQVETSRGALMADRTVDDNQWHHVATTYDGKGLRIYVDGVERSRQVRGGGPLGKSAWDLCIGNSVVDYGTGEFLGYEGWIDEVRVYNRALSGAEIKALATAKHAGVDAAGGEGTTGATGGKGDPAERMKKLKELLDQGLITKEEYDRKAKEILDSL